MKTLFGTIAITVILCGVTITHGEEVNLQPGTPEYYQAHIVDRYSFDDGMMKQIFTNMIRNGKVTQVLNTNSLLVELSRKLPSGAIGVDNIIVEVFCAGDYKTNDTLLVKAPDDIMPVVYPHYECLTSDGSTILFPVFDVYIPEKSISYEEYLEVYKKDNTPKTSITIEKILSFPTRSMMRENQHQSYAEKRREQSSSESDQKK